MKKIISIILCVTMLFSMVGCGQSVDDGLQSGDVLFQDEDLKVILVTEIGTFGYKATARVEVLTDEYADGENLGLYMAWVSGTNSGSSLTDAVLEKGESQDFNIKYFDTEEELQSFLEKLTVTAEIGDHEEFSNLRPTTAIIVNDSPSVSEVVVSEDNISFTLTSAHSDYPIASIANLQKPFDITLEMEYIGEDEAITVSGSGTIYCVNLYDEAGEVVGIVSEVPVILKDHVFNQGIAKTASYYFPVTQDGKTFTNPEVGNYTVVANIKYQTQEGKNVDFDITLPITVTSILISLCR
ncbi:MAG: hypothetical protein R3Y45_05425 [Bacillota bacterium]